MFSFATVEAASILGNAGRPTRAAHAGALDARWGRRG
jgi:hypothetical protein